MKYCRPVGHTGVIFLPQKAHLVQSHIKESMSTEVREATWPSQPAAASYVLAKCLTAIALVAFSTSLAPEKPVLKTQCLSVMVLASTRHSATHSCDQHEKHGTEIGEDNPGGHRAGTLRELVFLAGLPFSLLSKVLGHSGKKGKSVPMQLWGQMSTACWCLS